MILCITFFLLLLQFFYRLFSNIGADHMLYTEDDLEKSMDKIEVIDFHEQKEVNGIKFWCYVAGHVLGACMFMIEIAGVKVIFFFCLLKEFWKTFFSFFRFYIREIFLGWKIVICAPPRCRTFVPTF